MSVLKSLFGGKSSTVTVNVLDPHGNYVAEWKVGKDIPAEVVAKAIDKNTGQLYAVTTYDAGKGVTKVCLREQWLQVKARMDAIDQEGADFMARQKQRYPEIFGRGGS